MLRIALLLATLPVSLPEEWGRLAVVESHQTPAASTVVLAYENDTGRAFKKVRLECTLLDHRGELVSTGAAELLDVTAGAKRTERLRITDSSQRASSAKCRIAYAASP